MILKTEGIALRFIKYRESSIISTVFTRNRGIRSLIVNGVRTKKPKFNVALFQPFTIIQLGIYDKENMDLLRISDAQLYKPHQTIPFDSKKSSISLFLAEILASVLRHESHPDAAFDFIKESILTFDQLEKEVSNFHIQFLLKLTKYLGFYPKSGLSWANDLGNSDPLEKLLVNPYGFRIPGLSSPDRIEMINQLLNYYSINMEGFQIPKSYKILRDVLH